MKKNAANVLNRGRVRFTIVLMAAVFILTASVPSFAQNLYAHRDHVYGLTTDVYHWAFVGDEREVLKVVGDGNADLDLYVYDENGNLVAKDDDDSAYCVVRFVPRWTGNFTIKVVNRSRVGSTYVIATN